MTRRAASCATPTRATRAPWRVQRSTGCACRSSTRSAPTGKQRGMHKLWRNAHLAVCDEAMTVIEAGALVTRGAEIEWIGAEASLPAALASTPGLDVIDLQGAWVTPGLI